MKCTVLSDNFKKALSHVERATGKDITLPVLSSFFISADSGVVKITGTNLEIGIQTSLRGTIQKPGSVVIPARPLIAFIATLSREDKISLEAHKTDLVVSDGTQETVFKGFQQQDFPPFPEVKEVYKISLKKEELLRVLTKNLIAVSKSSVKQELASVFFRMEKGILTTAATDGFRLSEEKIKLLSFSTKVISESFLLPVRTCEELIRLMEQGDNNSVEIAIGSGEISVIYGDIVLYSRLTEGKFPEYQPIIPSKFTTSMTVDKKDFMRSVKRASIFSDKLQGVFLKLLPKQNECMVESKNTLGTHKSSFKSNIDGDSLSIVFNYHYLLDGIDSHSRDKIFLGFSGEASPLLIKEPNSENSFYVVMPMKGNV